MFMPLLQDQSAHLLNYVLDGKTKLFEQDLGAEAPTRPIARAGIAEPTLVS
jgi:hypothetical protein